MVITKTLWNSANYLRMAVYPQVSRLFHKFSTIAVDGKTTIS